MGTMIKRQRLSRFIWRHNVIHFMNLSTLKETFKVKQGRTSGNLSSIIAVTITVTVSAVGVYVLYYLVAS